MPNRPATLMGAAPLSYPYSYGGTAMTTTTRLTLEEFLELPDTKPASEYACGEVFQKPSAGFMRSALRGYLAYRMYDFVQAHRFGEFAFGWNCVFGPDDDQRVYVPDLMFISAERVTNDETFWGAPDLTVDVLTPEHDAYRFAARIQFYLENGVRLAWVLNTTRHTAVIFRPGEDERELTEADTLDGEDVLPGFCLPLAELFAQLDPLAPPSV